MFIMHQVPRRRRTNRPRCPRRAILIKTPVWYHHAKWYHLPIKRAPTLLGLLPNLTLNTPLQSLALIVLELPLLLLGLIASQTSKSAPHGPANTVADALSKVAQLALGFLAFALGVLLLTGLAHAFEAKGASNGLFAGAYRLVPRAGGAVRVVLRDTLRADRVAADVGAGVGKVFAGFSFGFLLLGLVLFSVVSDSWVLCEAW